MTDVSLLNDELDRMVLGGKAMDAFEKFYAEDVVMQENTSEPTAGKAANRQRELDFFAKVEQFHGMKIIGSAARGDRSYSEVEMDITFKGGVRVQMNQVCARQWKNGQIVNERFYYKG